MPAKKQSKTNWSSTIVDFPDIGTDKFSFTKPKLNKQGSQQIGILYVGKRLYVKYREHTAPFGLQEQLDRETERVTGTNIQISVPKRDTYFEKGKEFDDFFY